MSDVHERRGVQETPMSPSVLELLLMALIILILYKGITEYSFFQDFISSHFLFFCSYYSSLASLSI